MWIQLFQAIAKGGGALLSSNAGYQGSKLESDQADYDADQAITAGQDQARLIRRAGARVLGTQRADYAASGVQVGQGSAEQVERETITDSTHDAFQAILQGQRQALALRTQAHLGRITARAAFASTLIDPLASAGGISMSGWKTKPSPTLNGGNSYQGASGGFYANNDLSGTSRGSGD